MTFTYPLGFLALLAIPVLIFIYIIKNRYTEQTVTSTYLWTLSEKFLRRRIPINRITGILSLILQCLAVFLIAVIVSQPVIYISGGARDYCFVLDASASMNIEQDGSTRFEEAKKQIAEIIDQSKNGSSYTLIYGGNPVVTIYRQNSNKERALEALEALEVSYTESTISSALGTAQDFFNLNPSIDTYLVTDKTYAEGATKNVKVINVLSGTENYSVYDVTYQISPDSLTISGKVASYAADAQITLDFYFDGEEEKTFSDTVEVTMSAEAPYERVKEFEYQFDKTSFESFRVCIPQTDSLMLDNEVIVYNVNHENIAPTLVVYTKTINENGEEEYKEPFYLSSALRSAGNNQLEFVTDLRYSGMTDAEKANYGLYIFYNCVPSEMPREGVVWFVNPPAGMKDGYFNVQGEIIPSTNAVYNNNSNSAIQSMREGIMFTEFELSQYTKLGTTGGSFIEYIRCEGNPVLMTGLNAYGNREVVFGFDLTASAFFGFTSDCTTVLARLLSYSFPEVVEETSFYSGDTLLINRIPGSVSARVETPLGNSEYPDLSTGYGEVTLNEVGVYTVYLTMNNGNDRVMYVYSSMPVAERALTSEEVSFMINGVASDNYPARRMDNLLIIFIILAVIAVADYGVYCYEQYQLR